MEEGCGSWSGSCWPPGDLRCSLGAVICSPSSVMAWAEGVISWAGWIRCFCPCTCGLQSCRSHLAQGCRTSPALPTPAYSFLMNLDHKVLSSRTGQKINQDPNAAKPKKRIINHKSHISLTSPTSNSTEGVSCIGYLLPGFAPVPAWPQH